MRGDERLSAKFTSSEVGSRLFRLTLFAAFALSGEVLPLAAETAAMAPAPAMTEALAALARLLLMAVAVDRLWLAATGDESRQARRIAIGWLLRIRLLLRRLLLGTCVLLLIARREGLRIAWQIRLRLRHVARLVLPHEGRLAVFVVAVEIVSGALRCARLLLLRVIRILLPELLLRGGDQTEIMFGVLIIIFGRDRIAGALRVARELNVLFSDVRGSAADFNVGPVRLVDARQRILALTVAAAVIATPHALLTVSHDVPVRRPFTLSRRSPPNACHSNRKSTRNVMAQPDLHRVRANGRLFCATDIALTAATP
ncbi:hypothetical protein MXD81_00820 [Microbacteriaceae bacterium K1510]|nr:hypothetical protein [Microbacteriaceae bacterium K1510]